MLPKTKITSDANLPMIWESSLASSQINPFIFSEPQSGPKNAPPNGYSNRALGKIEQDWREWLRLVGPRTFTGSFADFHSQFWDWYWSLVWKRKNGEAIAQDEQAFLAIWARGFAKSSTVEWAAIAEGALIGSGYVLYVSGTQALADGHVQSIRERLESDEVSRFYPHLSSPKVGKHGNQFGWRQDFLITSGGWAIRPLGLDVGVRGGRVGDLRPTLIIFDDVDDHSDSPLVVQNKLETIARSIIPAGTKNTVILGAQNLIHRNSVFNQILSRKTSVLSRRIVSGPFPAFDGLEIETQQTATGPRNVIVSGSPTWPDMDLAACQKFLDDSGREAFEAEYQHNFALSEQGRVIPEYDEELHVISWSMFEAVFGARRIPSHWLCEVGHDVGFTKEHLSAWTWIATSAANSKRPGLRFRYRGLTFDSVGIDEQAETVKAALWPGEVIQRWRMSHEALSERMTYRVKYSLPFQACNSAKTAGIHQWRHYLRVDRSQPHPFKEDELIAPNTYRLGCPSWFDVVDDDQLVTARDDKGLAIHRRQTLSWQYRPDILGVGGLSKNEPMKADEDSCDSTRMVTASWGPNAQPLSEDEEIENAMPKGLRRDAIAQLSHDAADFALLQRDYELAQLKRARQQERSNWSHQEVCDPNDDPLKAIERMQSAPWAQ